MKIYKTDWNNPEGMGWSYEKNIPLLKICILLKS